MALILCCNWQSSSASAQVDDVAWWCCSPAVQGSLVGCNRWFAGRLQWSLWWKAIYVFGLKAFAQTFSPAPSQRRQVPVLALVPRLIEIANPCVRDKTRLGCAADSRIPFDRVPSLLICLPPAALGCEFCTHLSAWRRRTEIQLRWCGAITGLTRWFQYSFA